MSRRGNTSDKGSAGCGCLLLVMALFGWGFCFLIFPKMPGYDAAMEDGDTVPGKVVRIETVENVTINDEHPKRVVFSYGEDKEGSMMMAMKESASEGQSVQIKVLGENAYPQDIEPFAKPSWLNYLLIGATALGLLFLVWGVLRLLLIGGILISAAKKAKDQGGGEPPPPPPPPAP